MAKSMPSGIFISVAAGTVSFSLMPPQPGTAMTRSPTCTPLAPSPKASTTPASSPPGEKGRSGLNWYRSSMIRVSGKFTPTAFTVTSASPLPGTGSAISSTTSVSGPPAALDRTARMNSLPTDRGPVARVHPER